MYCLVVYVDMNGEGGWVVRVRFGREIYADASGSVEQFCQIAFDYVCMLCRALSTESMSMGLLLGLLCCLHVGVPVLSQLGGCLDSSFVVSMWTFNALTFGGYLLTASGD